MGGDSCPVVYIKGAHVQGNGIIRLSNGMYIGRLDGITYEEIVSLEQLEDEKNKPRELTK